MKLTPDELARIWKQIQSSGPGLYIPIIRGRPVEKLGPRLAVFRSYSEISKDDDAAEKYWETVQEIPRDAALATLSAINLINALAPTDPQAHGALNRTFIREEYLRQLAELQKEKGPQPDLHVVFSRGGILANLKALIGCLSENGAEKALDLHLIGDLSLLCNDFVGSTYLKEEPEQVDDIHLLIEFIATWELDNPRDVAYALTRVERMIKTYLPSADPIIAKLRTDIGLNPKALQYDGLELDDYIAIIFGIYGHTKRFDVEAIFRKPGEVIIDPKTFVSKTHFPQDKFEHFLNERSLSLTDYRERLTGGKEWDKKAFSDLVKTDQFSTDTLPFKTYPLLRWTDGRVLILDPQYVSDLLIYGLYWRIVDNLDDKKQILL